MMFIPQQYGGETKKGFQSQDKTTGMQVLLVHIGHFSK